jgi:hypothetical protein
VKKKSLPETYAVDFAMLPQPVLGEHPEWKELYRFAWRVAAKHIRKSRGRWHMDAAWDEALNYQWVWDTCFMVLYCRYGAGQYPGVQSLDNFYELQRQDGYISMTYSMITEKEPWPDRINPPLFAWVEWEYARTTGDTSRLARVTPHIEKLMAWIDANRRTRPHRRRVAVDGPAAGRGESANSYQLYHFEDAGSSGMDDSPRAPRIQEAGQYMDWIDLSAQMALSFRMLAAMHSQMRNRKRAAYWTKRAADIGALINEELWCERTRFYHDRIIPDNFVAAKTVAGFWPVLAGICPLERRKALLDHLRNKREFNRPTPVPSLSADDPNYDEKGMYWRGGVWAPTNYMIARGLMTVGHGDVAHEIACRYLSALARTYARIRPHTLWECYASESDGPGITAYLRQRVKPDFVGWTGIGPIAMLIENVLGFDVDALKRCVTWDIRLTEEHGVRNLDLGSMGRVTFMAKARKTVSARVKVEIIAEKPFVAILRCAGRTVRVRTSPGRRMQANV